MLSSVEGSTMARDLLRDGMVPLTEDAVRQYLTGLGADHSVPLSMRLPRGSCPAGQPS